MQRVTMNDFCEIGTWMVLSLGGIRQFERSEHGVNGPARIILLHGLKQMVVHPIRVT